MINNITNIEMANITYENLVEYAKHHPNSTPHLVFYDNEFDINRLSDKFCFYKVFVFNKKISLYLTFINDPHNNHIKLCSIGHDNDIIVNHGVSNILIMDMIIPSTRMTKHHKTAYIHPLNPFHLYNYEPEKSSVSISLNSTDNDWLRGLTPTEITISCSTFANVRILQYLTRSKHINISRK